LLTITVKNPFQSFITKKIKRKLLNLSIRPGINISSLSVTYNSSDISNFKSKLSTRIGLEAEFTLPFNKNKWAIILEPSYQYFKSTISNNLTAKANYQSLDINFGVRHSFFLNDKSKVFINGALNLYIPFNSKIVPKNMPALETGSGKNFIFGLGYKYARYSLEAQYGLPRDILTNYVFWKSKYKVFAIVAGFSLFKNSR
jgi:hypothetical protein